jgi:hypothetical protein
MEIEDEEITTNNKNNINEINNSGIKLKITNY